MGQWDSYLQEGKHRRGWGDTHRCQLLDLVLTTLFLWCYLIHCIFGNRGMPSYILILFLNESMNEIKAIKHVHWQRSYKYCVTIRVATCSLSTDCFEICHSIFWIQFQPFLSQTVAENLTALGRPCKEPGWVPLEKANQTYFRATGKSGTRPNMWNICHHCPELRHERIVNLVV